MTKNDVLTLIEEVANARGITVDDIRASHRCQHVASARRAINMILLDKYSLKGSHNNAVPLVEVANLMNSARSSMFASARNWRTQEGAQDGQKEKSLREKGCLLPQGKESIHEMAKRLCKRRLGEVPQGGRRELGYWRSQEEVNHG